MRKLKVLFLILSVALPSMAQKTNNGSGDSFDWNPVIDAIAWNESKNQPNATNGIYVGILQIAPVGVQECNNILKQRGETKRYTLNDRRNPEKSREMFRLIMSKYNPENDIDKACRIWKGGIRYNIKKTQPFVDWVRAYMKKQEEKKNQ